MATAPAASIFNRKGSFVLEAKQSRWKGGNKEIKNQDDLFAAEDEPEERGKRGAARAWDVLMLNAKRQAEEYARALPAVHGWPPFILVCDVGHCIEVYADFTGQGKNYTQFPDRQSFRIYLEDLRKPEVRETRKRIWKSRSRSIRPARGQGNARDRRAPRRRVEGAGSEEISSRTGRAVPDALPVHDVRPA